MPYWKLYYHFVWGTKQREPLLIPEIEPLVFDAVAAKAKSLDAMVHAVGGWRDHVHLVAAVPPTVALSSFVGKVKGASSRRIGQIHRFGWQAEYGVFSFDHKRLRPICEYVRHQKQHHEGGEPIPALETWGT